MPPVKIPSHRPSSVSLALLTLPLAAACAAGPPRSLAGSSAHESSAVRASTTTPVSPWRSTAPGVEVAAPAATKSDDAAGSEGPWRLHEALGLPDWLEVSGTQRTRYESVDEEFRGGQGGSNQSWALRTIVALTARHEAWRATAEIIDSRLLGAPDDANPGTTNVNALDVLQAHVGVEHQDVFADGDSLDVLFGRHTMDVGSRRLVARNRFRNTINAFTGLNALWEGAEGDAVRAFAVAPVLRLPTERDRVLDNEIRSDEELEETLFYGLHGSRPILDDRTSGELYLFALDEDDEEDVATRNRRLWTVGARVERRPKAERFHFEWESAFQTGESRSSASSTEDLDHRAWFTHLSVGYQFRGDTKTRLEGLFDYASGDEDPGDGENNRFDTLFGARRWEFGPTGIFGAFGRANLLSPGVRVTLNPFERTQFMFTHRFHYRASDEDAWTTAGLNDPGGSRTIGTLSEFRVKYDLVPKNVTLEVGAAYLNGGSFIDDTASADWDGNSTYVYFGTNVSF